MPTPEPVDRSALLIQRVYLLVSVAEAVEDEVRGWDARHDGFRMNVKRLTEVDRALDEVERTASLIREQTTELRRRWNDPDA